MEHAIAARATDDLDLVVDYPRTILNVAALLSVAICIMASALRLASDGVASLPGSYACLFAIQVSWLVGQALLIDRRR